VCGFRQGHVFHFSGSTGLFLENIKNRKNLGIGWFDHTPVCTVFTSFIHKKKKQELFHYGNNEKKKKTIF
jgi:hypothetical protein